MGKIRRIFLILIRLANFVLFTSCQKEVPVDPSTNASLSDYVVNCYYLGARRLDTKFDLLISNVPFPGFDSRKNEYERYWRSFTPFTCENVEASKTVSFNGQTYTGEHHHSQYKGYANYPAHIYRCPMDKDTSYWEFGFHADTGELVYLMHMPPIHNVNEPYIDNAETVLPEKARQYAAMFVDLNEYQMLLPEEDVERNRYHFVRYINGLPSSDRILIQVSRQGEFVFVHFGNLNAFTEEYDPILNVFSQTTYLKIAESIIPEDMNVTVSECKDFYYDISPFGDVYLTGKVTYLFDGEEAKYRTYNLAFFLKEKTKTDN